MIMKNTKTDHRMINTDLAMCEYEDVGQIAFDSSAKDVHYLTNSNTQLQYKWDRIGTDKVLGRIQNLDDGSIVL